MLNLKFLAFIFVINLLLGCTNSPLQPPCSAGFQNIKNCPPNGAIVDEDVITHQTSRLWLPPDKHDKDYLELAMLADIPIQQAQVKLIGSSHQQAVSSLAIKIWLIEHAKYSIDMTYYIFARDLSGYAILGALCNAVKRGVT